MNWLFNKLGDLFSNMWVKGLTLIPIGFFALELREGLMILSLIVIMLIDALFGAFKARYVDNNFEWTLFGKKFSKKFLLYFFTLLASFILHNSYDFLEFWFYTIGSLIVFSEMGELLTKARQLGLPISIEFVSFWNSIIDDWVHAKFNIPRLPKQEPVHELTNQDVAGIVEQIDINTRDIEKGKEKRKELSQNISDLEGVVSGITK